jgi:hypothetical protein
MQTCHIQSCKCCDRIRILDAKALGDPGLLGTAEVSLPDAQLQPNAGPRDMWLPLQVCMQLSNAARLAADLQ